MSKSTTNSTPNKTVSCMTCMNACLHRYGNNPILAACLCKPQPYDDRFPYIVEVANIPRKCANYKQSLETKIVEIRVVAHERVV